MSDFNYESFFSNCLIDRFSTVEEWHVLRGKGIGGSDAGIVMNVSQYKTPYQLWEEKTGKRKVQFITNDAIEKGNALEPVMFDLFKVLYGSKYEVIDTKAISLTSKKYPFMRANLDGALIENSTGRKGILEIKSTTIHNSAMFKHWLPDELPILYFFQCLHYLLVTGFDFVVLYAILDIPWKGDIGEQETRIAIINREDVTADMQQLLAAENIFWNRVVSKTPPPFLEKRNKNLIY